MPGDLSGCGVNCHLIGVRVEHLLRLEISGVLIRLFLTNIDLLDLKTRLVHIVLVER